MKSDKECIQVELATDQKFEVQVEQAETQSHFEKFRNKEIHRKTQELSEEFDRIMSERSYSPSRVPQTERNFASVKDYFEADSNNKTVVRKHEAPTRRLI